MRSKATGLFRFKFTERTACKNAFRVFNQFIGRIKKTRLSAFNLLKSPCLIAGQLLHLSVSESRAVIHLKLYRAFPKFTFDFLYFGIDNRLTDLMNTGYSDKFNLHPFRFRRIPGNNTPTNGIFACRKSRKFSARALGSIGAFCRVNNALCGDKSLSGAAYRNDPRDTAVGITNDILNVNPCSERDFSIKEFFIERLSN